MKPSERISELLQSEEDTKIKNLKKLNLTEKDLNESVRIMQEWFQQQPHLPDVILDKTRLENIIISCKGSLERSKSTIDTYYSLKTACPEVFLNRDPLNSEIKDCMEGLALAFTPILTPEGTRIGCFKILDSDVFLVKSFYKLIFMTVDLRIQYDNGCDIITITDFNDIKLGHITQITPFLVKLFVKSCQDAYVARIKGIHLVNVPRYAETLINVIKTVLSEKLRSRLFVHSSFDDLHKCLDKKLLPKDFGGELRSVKEIQDDWFQELVENRDWFLEGDKHQVDERKRLEKPMINDLLGTHGSFRKLDVD